MSRLKKIEIERDLVIIDVLTLILILVIALLPITWLRIVLGLPFILFFPGYTLIAALFPRKEGLGNIERFILSFGLSIAVVPLIGLILNYTPWGIDLYPILLSISFFILVMSSIALYKRRIYAPGDRFSISSLYKHQLHGLKWQEMAGLDKVLSIVLVISILGALGTLGYVISTPKVGEKFTEFYILGQGGAAAYYPEELAVGEVGNVTIGIVNREHDTMSYHLEVWVLKDATEKQVNIWMGEEELERVEVDLAHEEKWESEIGFAPFYSTTSTTLSAPVTNGDSTLVVADAEEFDVGDYIQIGSTDEDTAEIVQIKEIDLTNSKIEIKTELENDHDEGDSVTVIEKQKVEFRLFKDGDSEPCTLSSPATQGQMTLVVEGTDKFDVGDYIQIGSTEEETAEIVQIEGIDVAESEITIKSELEYDHDDGETVIEIMCLHLYVDVIPA